MGYYETLTLNQKIALTQHPQFCNLTPNEINNIFAKFDDLDIVEAMEYKRNHILNAREVVAQYIADGRLVNPLPAEEVKIDRGVRLTTNASGFISFELINLSDVYFRLSLPNKSYSYMKEGLIKFILSKYEFPVYSERSYDYIHFR